MLNGCLSCLIAQNIISFGIGSINGDDIKIYKARFVLKPIRNSIVKYFKLSQLLNKLLNLIQYKLKLT